MRTAAVLVAALLFTAPVLAQGILSPDPLNPIDKNLTLPSDWRVHFDDAEPAPVVSGEREEADAWFVHMTPGWHVTAGPAAVYYPQATRVDGLFRAETLIHLFPDSEDGGYGLFVGDPEGEGLAFVIRNTGDYSLRHHTPDGVHPLVEWTRHDGIRSAPGEDVVTNRLTLVVRGGNLHLLINDQRVHAMPQEGLPTSGTVGLRLDEGPLNMHVEDFLVRTQGG